MRITINIKNHNNPADVRRALRSLATKITDEALEAGTITNVTDDVRVTVAESNISEIREFAIKFGFPVGKRGKFPSAVLEQWAVYDNAADKRKVAASIRKVVKALHPEEVEVADTVDA